MTRITNKDLEAVVARINRATDSPDTSWTRTDAGMKANIGNYHISGAYGGVSLHRMVTDGGGITDVFSCGHITKRDLYDRMQAYLAGLSDAEGYL